MVLVDTSVWIRFLANRLDAAEVLEALLDRNEVAAHDAVYGELLIGESNGRDSFLLSYSLIAQLPTVPHDEVVEFVKVRRLRGAGIGWIDAQILSSALVGGAQLWTVDLKLAAAAARLGIGYRPDRHH